MYGGIVEVFILPFFEDLGVVCRGFVVFPIGSDFKSFEGMLDLFFNTLVMISHLFKYDRSGACSTFFTFFTSDIELCFSIYWVV